MSFRGGNLPESGTAAAVTLPGRLSMEQLIVPAATKDFCKDIALFTQALMLKTSPDRFDHWSGSACRLGF